MSLISVYIEECTNTGEDNSVFCIMRYTISFDGINEEEIGQRTVYCDLQELREMVKDTRVVINADDQGWELCG